MNIEVVEFNQFLIKEPGSNSFKDGPEIITLAISKNRSYKP